MLTEPPCFGWGISTSQFFFWVQNFYSLFQFFFWVQNFYSLFILIWDAFILFYFIFHLFVFVFILFEHPWHAIDVFVRLCECPFKKSYNFTNKKIFYFTLVYLEISQVSFLKCVVAYWKNVRGCNVEGSLKGEKKKKTKTLKPSGIAWENREFENYPPSCSTIS